MEISRIKLSVMDLVEKDTSYTEKVKSKLNEMFEDNERNIYYKDGIIVNFDVIYGTVELTKLNSTSDELIANISNEIENFLVNKINAKTVCKRIELKNGFSKHEFTKCEIYSPKKKSKFMQFLEKLY